ncbi:MAG: nitrilase-related carbon-nitrogen hydrolase [Candidatus Bathyarchaeia archaeon]
MQKIHAIGIQMTTGRDKAKNVEKAFGLLTNLKKRKHPIDLICFPEMFTFIPLPSDPPSICKQVAEKIPSCFTDELGRIAKKLRSYLISGSFLENRHGEYFNTSLLFNRQGQIIGQYSKIHLFEAPNYQESKFVKPGSELLLHKADFGNLGIIICYDIRFPELTRTICLKGADILAIPAAFPIADFSPGEDHWQILTKATALYNMVYVMAVNQIGSLGEIKFFGRSVIVDPWGVEIAKAPNTESIIYAEMDLEYANAMKKQRKIWEHRRVALYLNWMYQGSNK